MNEQKNPKVVCVYNCDKRNNGTAVYAWDAFKRGLGLGDNVLRLTRPLQEHDQKWFEGADLVLYVDDGRDDIPFPKIEVDCPTACWLVDTHLGFDTRFEIAKNFDYVFCAQQDGAEMMTERGIEKAFWLPLACSPTAHPNYTELMAHAEREKWEQMGGLAKMHDLAFVGFINEGAGPGSHNRLDYLHDLFQAIPNSWITPNCFFEDMAYRFVRARMVPNISIRNDLNMRFFEAMSTGTCLLTNTDVVGISDLGFVEGEHFIGYEGIDQMIEKAQWGLNNPMEREEIAKAGHDLVRSKHTYAHRMADIFAHCGVDLYREKWTVMAETPEVNGAIAFKV